MSGTLPNTSFTAINLQSNQKTLFSETDSGKSFRMQVQGQRFSFTVSYPPMKRSEFAPFMAFIMKQRSRQEDFTITMPSYLNAQGNFYPCCWTGLRYDHNKNIFNYTRI